MSGNGKTRTAFLETGAGDFREMYVKRWEEIQKGVQVTVSERKRFETSNAVPSSTGEITDKWFNG